MAIFPHAQNWANQMIFHECARPWFIWVTSFTPAFLKLFVTLATLDAEDILRDYAKGKAHEPTGGRRGGFGHVKKKGYAQVANKIDRFAQKGLKTLLVVTEPLEKIGFAWLLYSATDEFFYDWQTALMNSAYCTDAARGPFQRSRGGGANVPILPGGGATPLPNLDQNRANWTNGNFSVGLPAGSYTAMYAANVVAPNSGTPGAGAQIRVSGNIGPTLYQSGLTGLGPREHASLMIQATFFIPIGGSAGWELYGNAIPIGIECENARFIVMSVIQ